MKYNYDWYTTSEAVPYGDWLCAWSANVDFYEYAKKLRGRDILRAFNMVLRLIDATTNWPNDSLRVANLTSLFEDVEEILNAKENTHNELKTIQNLRESYGREIL